jgi:ribosomal protein L16 Arg81 hydroxylase
MRRRRLNKVRFYGHLNAGATLVLNRFELLSVAAQRLCAAVSRFAGQPATSNAYVSFRGDGTFGKHWDTHDVFALQLIGRKRWRLFAPTLPLPLSHQTSARSQQACPEAAVLDCVLEAGDMLYIPRGWWHQVTPLQEGSLHLSVGTYAATLTDYIMWACSRALPEDTDARAALHPGSMNALQGVLARLTKAIQNPRELQQFLHQIEQREVTTSEFNLAWFADSDTQPLPTTTRVQLNTAHLRTSGDTVLVNGAVLSLDALSMRILHWLGQAGTATLGELAQQAPGAAMDSLRLAIMNLNRHEVVSLTLPPPTV